MGDFLAQPDKELEDEYQKLVAEVKRRYPNCTDFEWERSTAISNIKAKRLAEKIQNVVKKQNFEGNCFGE